MSSRQNSRNLFTNVFRPTYVHDGTQFRVGLVMSNITSVRSDIIGSGILEVGDACGNVYIGTGAGSVGLSNYNNVGLGVNAAAGISNVSNSVFIGSNAGAALVNANETTIIGTNNTVTGTRNVIIGSRDLVTGDNNVMIGSDLSENRSYRLNIGNLILGDISLGGNLQFNANVVISGTLQCDAFNAGALDTSNLVVPGYIRNAAGATPYSMDISGGNLNFTGTGTSRVSDVSLYRGRINAPSGIFGTGYDLSSTLAVTGDVSSGGRVTAVNFFGTTDSASNKIGGVTLSNTNISYAGTITGSTDSASNKIGGVTLSNTNISYAGTIIGSTDNTSNKIGGVTLSNTTISNSSASSNSIGGVTLSNTNISYAGTITGSTDNTSNRIGGVILSNTNVSNVGTVSSTNAIVSGYLRNALSPNQFDISGGNISNSATHIASNFIGNVGASNSIGGVTLSNAGNTITLGNGFITDISTTPYFRLGTTTTSFQVDMSGGNISNSATHIASNFIGSSSASNSIGGVTLSNTNISYAGTITGSTDNTSNRVGGVTLSNTNISYAGTITGTTDSASNKIGGVTLSNTNVSYAGTMTGTTDSASNRIGGVTLSNTNISYAGTITGSTDSASNKIGGVTLSNSNVFVASGTVANPAYAFSTDTSLGLYRVGAGQLGVASSGSNRITIGSNVGIGTTAPGFPLEVASSNAAGESAVLFLRNSAANNNANTVSIRFGPSSGAVTGNAAIVGGYDDFSTGRGNLSFQTFNGGFKERIRIDSFGNVGIATSIPTVTLTVSGDISANEILTRFGTAAAPAYTFSGDESSGLYLVSASNLGITAGGVERVRIASSGNVGIATSIPTVALTVSGDISANEILTRFGTAAAPAYTFSGDESSGLYLASASNLGITAGGVERVRIASSGNVGIGNTPAYRLDVSGITMVRGTLYGGAAAATGGLVPGNYLGIYSNILYNETSTGGLYIGAGGLCNTIVGRRGTIYITADGSNVGIGTNAPSTMFQVSDASGFMQFTAPSEVSSTGRINIVGPNIANPNSGGQITNSELAFGARAIAQGPFYSCVIRSINLGGGAFADCNRMGFFTYPAAGDTTLRERMTILPNGNIGISNISPSHALDVSGTIRGSSNIVSVATTSNWVGSYTSFTDTSLTITYTPKQSGSVRLMVIANAELLVGSGTGTSDGVNLAIRNNGTILTDYNLNFDQQAVVGRSTNNHYSGGRMAIVSVTGQSLINMRITRIGDDDSTVRNGYLSIHELSTT